MAEATKRLLAVRYIDDETIELVFQAETEVAVPLLPETAASIGQALLAASAVGKGGPPKPASGTEIQNCHFPVVRWSVGRSNANGDPVLVLETQGGANLVFQMPAEAARESGKALSTEGGRRLAKRTS